MRRHSLWLSLLVSVASVASAPVTASQGEGHGKPDKAQSSGHTEKKAKPPKGAKGAATKHVDEHARLHGLDTNHDGVVTRAEWNGDGRSFANHDWNHDDVLSGAELEPGAPGAPRQAPNAQPGPPGPAAAPVPKKHTESDEVLFARRDTDHDGRISRREWVGDASTFERLDFNKDGWLSPYEYGVGR